MSADDAAGAGSGEAAAGGEGRGVGRVLVVMPTYDEATTVPVTVARLRTVVPQVDVLVVDDASPDGTGEVADALAAADPSVQVLHRTAKEGLGAAYVAGFRWALGAGYDVVVEMDADGSHQAEDLPRLLAALAEPSRPALVLGSRWIPGGRVLDWPWHRMVLSRAGNTYTRVALGLPLADATGGFRAYRADVLAGLPLAEVASHGYCFQVDMAWRLHQAGGVIREVPITFVERTEGRSKMSNRIVGEALVRVTAWGLRHRWRQVWRVLGNVARWRGSGRAN